MNYGTLCMYWFNLGEMKYVTVWQVWLAQTQSQLFDPHCVFMIEQGSVILANVQRFSF
jgi:hypothetical protein